MNIGYHLGYWSSGPPAQVQELVRELEDLGFDSLWTAEAYGSDALTPLAWWGASTSRIRLATRDPDVGTHAHRCCDGRHDAGSP
jgi:alkanesulfonate monooxygenase SsuD/methylene tetrahydromethanopterin reductase-like flavin-dependent oxidoreductase (luciferase family)